MPVGVLLLLFTSKEMTTYLAVLLGQAHSRWLINMHRMYQIKMVEHISWLLFTSSSII